MKNTIRNGLMALVGLAVLVLTGCNSALEEQASCIEVLGVEGSYACAGECVDARLTVTPVANERDLIALVPGSGGGLYKVTIAGAGGFTETEIGALTGNVLRTSTHAVSKGGFPVLEEYVFDTDSACQATGYTKIVRNPTDPAQGNFKACHIVCRK